MMNNFQEMKVFRILIVATLLTGFTSIGNYAQVGIKSQYSMNNFSDWNNWARNNTQIDEFFSSMVEFGLDYGISFSQVRLKLHPYLSYGQGTTQIRNSTEYLNLRQYGLGLDFRYYPMDDSDNCNCPTFSKQGDFLQKSFFVLLTLGVRKYKLDTALESVPEDSGIAYQIAVGAGLDFGFSDFFTLTPFTQLAYGGGYNYSTLQSAYDVPNDFKSSVVQTVLGVRMGFRFEYLGNKGR